MYESPGGTVPVIVTVYGVPRGYRARIAAGGTSGADASCSGPVWHNRRRATASRKCYLHLPLERGSYNVRGHARLVKDGATDLVVSGVGSRAVKAEGYKSYTRMSAERIRRVERCFNDTRRVWLTFDDGGSPTQVRSILETLRRNGVRGRFLFTGAWAAENPGVMREIRQGGHLVANHTYSHAPLSKTSDAGVRRQIRRGVQATTQPKLLRPPYAAGAFTTRLWKLAEREGYRLCRWTVDTYDWDEMSAARMAERVRVGDYRSPPVRAGGNILMHGGGRYTASGLQGIIDAVRRRGLSLDRLR